MLWEQEIDGSNPSIPILIMVDSALILAGGRSSRMGFDKKLLKLGDMMIMDRLITCLRSLFSEILVSVGNDKDFSRENRVIENVTFIHDEIGSGPLAGIYQGLKLCKSDDLYVTACDMPFISFDYIKYMKEIVISKSMDACVARRKDNRYEPFNSFFNKRCLPTLRDSLIRKEYKVSLFLDKINPYIVKPEIVETFGDIFFNINCPEDLERAEKDLYR